MSDVHSHFALDFKLLTAAGKLGELFWSREAKAQVRGVLSVDLTPVLLFC